MKSICFHIVLFCVLLCNVSFAGKLNEYNKALEYLQKKGEVYLSFDAGSRSRINAITQIMSIDNIQSKKIYAYAINLATKQTSTNLVKALN